MFSVRTGVSKALEGVFGFLVFLRNVKFAAKAIAQLGRQESELNPQFSFLT